LEFPHGIQRIRTALKPLAIDLQSILQLDCLAGSDFTFYAFWVVRCFIIPGLMLAAVGVQYIYERRRTDRHTAMGYFKANSFVVIFLIYPGVCNQAFSIYNCRELDGGLRVLNKEYSVECSTDKHPGYELVKVND
jgi:hypothetical protein